METNFLDLLRIRNPTNLETDIYRKPTTTTITIDFLSNHPTEHQIAAYRYHIARMQSLPLTTERQQTGWNTIKSIVKSNNFPDKILTLKEKLQQKTHQLPDKEENRNKKWTVFTYYSPTRGNVANLFKHINIGIAFRSANTMQHMKPKTTNNTQEYNKSGIYKLTCNTCKLSYIGQTSRNVKQRYQEHIRYIRNSDPQSANAHEYGSVTDTMILLKPEHKTSMLIP